MDTSTVRKGEYTPIGSRVASFDAFFRHAFEPMLLLRLDGSVIAANDAAGAVLGLAVNEIQQTNISSYLEYSAFEVIVANQHREDLASGEFLMCHANGSRFSAEVRVAKIANGAESLFGMTFRKTSEPNAPNRENLDDSAHWIAALNKLPVPILLTRLPEHTIVTANAEFLSTFGYTIDEIKDRKSLDLHISDMASRQRVLDAFGLTGSYRDVQIVNVRRQSSPRVFSVSGNTIKINGAPHIITVLVQVNSQLSDRQVTQASEERLSDFVRNAPLSMALFDNRMDFIAHSHRFLEEFRFPPTNLEGTSLYEAFPNLPESIKATHRRCLTGASETSEESPLPYPDGSTEWYRWEMTPWRDEFGNIGGVAFFSQRITELKRAKERIANQERLLADVTDGSPSIIAAFDREGRIMFANEAAAQAMGIPKAKLVGALATNILPDFQKLQVTKRHNEVMETGIPQIDETLLLTRDGPLAVLAARYPLRDTAGAVYGTASIITDISRQKQVEAELRRSEGQTRDALAALEKALEVTRKTEEKLILAQKMEAIGRLAGGIAHDFNNLLTVILGNSGEVLFSLRPEDPNYDLINEIEKAGQRAAGLTRQLLAFSRKQVLESRVVNVNELIVSAEKMLRRILGEDIEVTLLLDPQPQFCKLDKGQFEQVLLNLVVNARDAMADGGRLTIETASVMLDAGYFEDHQDFSPGEHVRITVSDTGSGIPREIQAQIFEPFFTTKSSTGGTGLGLSTAYGIIRQSGGTIGVYSEPGQGTTFKIYFPRQTDAMSDAEPAVSKISTTRGKETILIVEDDEQVRTTIAGILRRAGYHVISAVNGGEALLICEQHASTIHLLLTDVVMPKLNGRKLAERLLQIRPKMRTLFMSGYTENVVTHHGILDSNFNFLPKPVTAETLLPKIRAVFEGP
jgi:two-component system, cell cycle sensor histidine kinase and response regulator CckA